MLFAEEVAGAVPVMAVKGIAEGVTESLEEGVERGV